MSESENTSQRMTGHSVARISQGEIVSSAPLESYGSYSDETLITLFQQGDTQAFRFLVERHRERVRNLIYSMFHEEGIVDDLTQEVFIKAYEALPDFRFESSFYTWLYRIAVNKGRDELRKRKIRRVLSLQSILDAPDGEAKNKMVTHQQETEVQELIAKGLQKLPEKFRLAVILKDMNGFSYEEMAEVMQCEIGTVKSRLSRGRSMLRSFLKPFLEEQP
ncbi:MAG TPA: sigma-70 family RNA polymerase sigma factor [Bacteroidota bacterium]|nr:sigma-70 family RNA polymerase sigma factor [Bacteroidota bacterium]